MRAHMLNITSSIRAGRKPQLVRAHVVPQAKRRFKKPCGPTLMALSPFDSLFDLSPSHLLETEEFVGLERARAMAVDFVEDSQGFQIKADIPGVAKRDIKLDVDHNVVTISAKRSTSSSSSKAQGVSMGDNADTQAVADGITAEFAQEEAEGDKILQQDANVLRYERFDSFHSRAFRVPKTADLSTIAAKYVDGVLTVDINKREDVLEDKRTVDIS